MKVLWNNLHLKNGWSFNINASKEELDNNFNLRLLSEISPKYITSKKNFFDYTKINKQEIQNLEDFGKLQIENILWKDIPEENNNYIIYLFPGNPYEGKSFII